MVLATDSNFCVVAGVSAVAAGKEDGTLGEFRNKLLSFLDISTSYEPARLISDFPFDGKFASRGRICRQSKHYDRFCLD